LADYTLTARLTANADQFVAGFKRAEGTVANLQGKVATSGKRFQELGSKISGVGDSLTRKITLPAVAAAGALMGVTLVKGFNRLVGIDTARAKLTALGHDGESVENIMTSALDSVKGTSFGLDEAATIAASAVAAGIDPGKDLTKYLTLTGDAAAVAGTDLNEMGSIFNKVQTAQRAYTGDLNQLADRGLPIYEWIGEAAGKSADEVRDMASRGEVSSEMFLNAIEKNIGGAAAIIGEESFMAGVANVGAAIGRLGANFLDAGGEAGGFFSTIKPLLGETIGFIDGLADKAQDLGVKFGNAFIGAIEKLGQLKTWFTNLSPPIQSLIIKGAAIGAAFLVGIGPVLKIVGSLISAFGTFKIVIAALMGPVGIAIAIFAGLVAAGVALYKNWDTVKAVAQNVFSSFSPLLNTVKGAFSDLIGSVGPIWDSLKNLFQSTVPILQALGAIFVTVFGVVLSVLAAVISAIGPIINAFINLADMLINVVLAAVSLLFGEWDMAIEYWNMATESAIEVFKSLWEGVVNFFSTFVETIIDFFMGLYMTLVGNSIIPDMVEAIVEWFHNMFDWLIDIVMNIVDGIVEAFTAIYETITSYFEMVGEIIGAVWEYITETFSNALDFILALVTGDFEGMKDAIQNQMQNAQDLLKNIWNAIDSFLSSTLGGIWDTVKSVFASIFSTISSILGNVKSTVSSIWNSIKSFFTTVVTAIVNLVKQRFDNLKNNVTTVFNAVKSFISNVWNGIKTVITTVVNAVRSVVTSVFNSVRSTISSVMSSVRSTISSVWNGIRSTISSVVNGIRSTISSIFNSLRGIVTGAMNGVRNAVSNGITGALNVITNMGSSFKNAGSKIVTMIADGIKGAASKVTGAAKDLMGKVRDYLPFSPAKIGPLTDIHRLNFDGPIGDSIDDAVPTIQRKMGILLGFPEQANPNEASLNYAQGTGLRHSMSYSGASDANGTDSHLAEAISDLRRGLTDLRIEMDGKDVGRIVEPHVTQKQNRLMARHRKTPRGI